MNARFAALMLMLSPATTFAQHDQGCPVSEVRFSKGSSGTVIAGVAPPEDNLCFDLPVRAGQEVQMRMLSGDNVIFTVYDVADARSDLTFQAPSDTVRFLVSQLFRAVEPRPFELEVTVR